MVAGLTLEFSVSADVNLSIGAQFDYTKGTRYTFTLLLFTKQSTSDQLDLVDETYNFDLYVMGTLGLRAGIIARVELGLFTLSLDSIGLELETGPYVRLWGYFFYELHYANHVRTSNTSGALYLELGIYFETRFLAQALSGQYSYNPTLYSHEWPLWSAGSRYNIYDFSYTLTDATDDIRMKGATKTYALPASALSMKQLDLTEGDVTSESHASSDFTVSFTNSCFSQTNGTISVTPPAGQHIAEGYMTVSWKGAPLSFTTVPISRTYHVAWDDLASSYMISFNSQLGSARQPDRRRLRKRCDAADAHPRRLRLRWVVHHCCVHRHRLHRDDDAGEQSHAVREVDASGDHAVHRQALSADAGRYFLRAVRHPEPHRGDGDLGHAGP